MERTGPPRGRSGCHECGRASNLLYRDSPLRRLRSRGDLKIRIFTYAKARRPRSVQELSVVHDPAACMRSSKIGVNGGRAPANPNLIIRPPPLLDFVRAGTSGHRCALGPSKSLSCRRRPAVAEFRSEVGRALPKTPGSEN